MGAQHEILYHEGLVAFEARAGRDGSGLEDALLMDSQLGAPAPAFARRTLLGRGLAGLLHPAWLDLGPAFEPLETGDLVPLRRNRVLQLRHFGQQLSHERLQLGTGQILKNRRGAHPHNESEREPIRELKTPIARAFAPLTVEVITPLFLLP